MTNVPFALGFDVYGTLVNPLGLTDELASLAGNQATALAQLWRTKQIEYSFRRTLMDRYADFDVCTREALSFAARSFNIALDNDDVERLLVAYTALPPFPDTRPGLAAIRAQGLPLVAFSNGVRTSLERLLHNAGIADLLDDIVSVDEIQHFKPHPSVYQHLALRLGQPIANVWLVSSNPWDVIGAKSAGLHAAWVQRDATNQYDTWGEAPDIIIPDILALADYLQRHR